MPKGIPRDRFIMIDKDLLDDPLLMAAAVALAARDEFRWVGDQELTDSEALWLARNRYVAALIRLWCYADTYINEDDTLPCGAWEVESIVGTPGFCDVSPHEWLQLVDDGKRVRLPGYCEKNDIVGRRKRKAKKALAARDRRDKKRNDYVTATNKPRKGHEAVTERPIPDTNTKEEKGAIAPSKKAQLTLIESELTPGLNREAWQHWLQYRREIGKPLKPASLTIAAHEMAALGSPAEQQDAVEFSIGRGYQGLIARPANGGGSATPRAWSTRPTQESALAAIEAAAAEARDEYDNGA